MPKRLADWVAPGFTCGHGSFCAPVSVSQPHAYVVLNIHFRTNSKMLANHISKSLKPVVGAAVLALALSVSSPAQNVGIGFSNPLSKLTVNGNFAVGTDYNLAAPTNGALIEGFTCIGTTAPDPGATGANDPFLTVASNGNGNITLRPSTSAPNTRAGIFFGDNTYLECTDSTTNGNKRVSSGNGILRTLRSAVSSWNRVRRHLKRNAEPPAQNSGSPAPVFP